MYDTKGTWINDIVWWQQRRRSMLHDFWKTWMAKWTKHKTIAYGCTIYNQMTHVAMLLKIVLANQIRKKLPYHFMANKYHNSPHLRLYNYYLDDSWLVQYICMGKLAHHCNDYDYYDISMRLFRTYADLYSTDCNFHIYFISIFCFMVYGYSIRVEQSKRIRVCQPSLWTHLNTGYFPCKYPCETCPVYLVFCYKQDDCILKPWKNDGHFAFSRTFSWNKVYKMWSKFPLNFCSNCTVEYKSA